MSQIAFQEIAKEAVNKHLQLMLSVKEIRSITPEQFALVKERSLQESAVKSFNLDDSDKEISVGRELQARIDHITTSELYDHPLDPVRSN